MVKGFEGDGNGVRHHTHVRVVLAEEEGTDKEGGCWCWCNASCSVVSCTLALL